MKAKPRSYICKENNRLYKVDSRQLRRIAKYYAKKHFNKDFNLRVIFNTRLRTTSGRFVMPPSDPYYIEINPKMITEHGMNCLCYTIKHELIHWYLKTKNMNDNHGKNFLQIAEKIEATLYCPSPLERFVYRCNKCRKIFHFKNKANNFTHALDDGHFTFIKKINKPVRDLPNSFSKFAKADKHLLP